MRPRKRDGWIRAAARRLFAPSRLSALGLAATLTACASSDGGDTPGFAAPETGLTYTPEIEGAPTPEIAALLEGSLAIFRRQDRGAQSLAFLRRRAEGDIATAQKILRAYGYYEAEVKTSVAPPEIRPSEGDGTSGDAAGAAREQAVATVQITPGRPFKLRSHRLIIEAPDDPAPMLDAAELGAPIGEPAAAAEILAAEVAAVAELRRNGRPYAERLERRAVAFPEEAALEVETRIAAGPAYAFGDIRFEGAERVERDYLLTYRPWEPGAPFDREALTAYERELTRTGLFSAAAARPPETPPDGARAPVIVQLDEAPRRTVSAGLRYDTDVGPAVRGRLEHRNLFGSNETGSIQMDVGLEEQLIAFRYEIPQYLRPRQDLTAQLELRRIEDEAFDELGATAAVGLERALSERTTVGLGLLAEYSVIDDDDEEDDGTAYLVGLPAFAAFDDSNDRFDPSDGFRLRGAVTPFAGSFDGEPVTFLSLDATAATYVALDEDATYVLAARSRLGSIFAAEVEDVPASRRLYSGGGGSVRGYRDRFIGPLDDDGEPEGGLSAAEAGLELRARLMESLGIAIFSEAGAVSEDVAPTFADGLQIAAGAGVRYFSPVGPIRLDVGAPVNGRDEDDLFQVYISIGQAY